MSLTNSQVIHRWAQNNGGSARSSNGNCWFDGPSLYSYRTVIARFHMGTGVVGPVCLITTRKYSVTTTGRHMPGAYDIAGARVFYVDDVDPADHSDNVEKMASEYAATLRSAEKARLHAASWAERARDIRQNAEAYAAAFGLPFDPAAFPETSTAAFQAALRRSEARAAEANRRVEIRRQQDALRAAEEIPAWREHQISTIWNSYAIPTMLRVSRDGTEIETSRGASFPVEHAVRAFMLLAKLASTGRTYQRNGHTIHLGHYAIDSFDGQNVVAGCHTVPWSEVVACAGLLGLTIAEAAAA